MAKRKIKFGLTPRQGIVAPKGYSIASLDFSGQELMIAAVWSQDQVMLDSFRLPETRIAPDGKEYPNPYSDLHTLSTVQCTFPKLFLNEDGTAKPWWEWTKIAKDGRLITQKGDPRSYSKILNFGVIYGQSATSISSFHHVPLATAETWLKNHQSTYHGFHDWFKETKAIGEARGWIETPWCKRVRWVNEDNAKGSGESPGIAAVNHCVQGAAADIGKIAGIRALDWINRNGLYDKVKIIGMVHDELLVMGPGRCRLNFEKSEFSEDGQTCTKPKWHVDEEVYEWVNPIRQIMIDTETESFDGMLTGRVGVGIAPYWSK